MQVAVDDRPAAETMCDAVVHERLAAAAQIVGPIRSSYRWQGEFVVSDEWLCLIILPEDRYEALERRLVELHPYEVPEIIALPLVAGAAPYFDWVRTEASAET